MDTLVIDGRRFEITRADAADLPDLVSLLTDDTIGATRETDDLAPYRRAFATIDGDPHQLLVAVRDEHAALVGTMQLTLIPGLARGGVTRLQIEAVRLAAEVRGAGLGRALLDWAHAYGREHGAGLAQLTSDQRRVDAHRFYEQAGYVASHRGFKRAL
jgi:GNAT superfamily N-acetyltransferase